MPNRLRTPRVVAVVVTWNRRELLAESLAAVTAQPEVDCVVVVDNASTDGSPEMVTDRFPTADLVRMQINTGGAGGFAAGLARAIEHHDPDAIWLMDDDTVPDPGALGTLVAAWTDHPGAPPAVVASRVVWTDGRDHPMNTPRTKPFVRRAEVLAAESVGCRPIRSASFVSILVSADDVRERGLPIADYFLWNDDFEFTTRLLRGRVGLYCPASVVRHKTATFGSSAADPGDRFFFEVRNKTWMFTRSRGLNPLERTAYATSTGRHWVRTFRGSSDRATLGRALVRGLRAGLTRAPRANDDVLGRRP